MYRRLNDFQKRFNLLENVTPQTDENKDLQQKVLNDVGDLLNELHYIYKDKCNEKNDLKTKDAKKFGDKKMRLTDDCQYESEEEKGQKASKKPDKKVSPKNQTKDHLNKLDKF